MKLLTKHILFIIITVSLISCKDEVQEKEPIILWKSYDETEEIDKQQEHEHDRMKFKLIQSKVTDKNEIFQQLFEEVSNFSEERYKELYPLIFEQDIPTIQSNIDTGLFTYEELTLFYLKRIYTYESDPNATLHTIMALNPEVLEQARMRDKERPNAMKHPIYGMPILLKDNITMTSLPATAGAAVLENSMSTKNAFIVSQLEKKGALILGKVNLSEWAYYFCTGCPLGYSALGGQTLNPYGRKIFETGGSSAGSGTSVAANYAVAAVGTETAGSIISPSSQNSLVGLKPTVGVLSRSGIVPISHSLDTPGPMTKSVVDTAILLDAMAGRDKEDAITKVKKNNYLLEDLSTDLTGKRFGVMKNLLSDSIYNASVMKLKENGAVLVEFDPPEVGLDGFRTLLNLEMKEDLPNYISNYTTGVSEIKSLEDIVIFNKKDSLIRMPYNQELFDGIISDTTSTAEFERIKTELFKNGNTFFQQPIKEHQLDAVLSVNNYHSAYAAVGFHPCLAIPMGYKNSGEPIAITLIASPFQEKKLLQLGYMVENVLNVRVPPEAYKD